MELRRLFILLTAFGYAFLSGGPSLWALKLEAGKKPSACSAMGCSCRHLQGKPAKACCCMKLHPRQAQNSLSGQSCASSSESDQQAALPTQRPHLAPSAEFKFFQNLVFLSLEEGLIPSSFSPDPPAKVPLHAS